MRCVGAYVWRGKIKQKTKTPHRLGEVQAGVTKRPQQKNIQGTAHTLHHTKTTNHTLRLSIEAARSRSLSHRPDDVPSPRLPLPASGGGGGPAAMRTPPTPPAAPASTAAVPPDRPPLPSRGAKPRWDVALARASRPPLACVGFCGLFSRKEIPSAHARERKRKAHKRCQQQKNTSETNNNTNTPILNNSSRGKQHNRQSPPPPLLPHQRYRHHQ